MNKTNGRHADLIRKMFAAVLCAQALCISIRLPVNAASLITSADDGCVYSHIESGFSIVIPDDYYYLTEHEQRGYDEFYSAKEITEMADSAQMQGGHQISADEYKKAEDMLGTSVVKAYEPAAAALEDGSSGAQKDGVKSDSENKSLVIDWSRFWEYLVTLLKGVVGDDLS